MYLPTTCGGAYTSKCESTYFPLLCSCIWRDGISEERFPHESKVLFMTLKQNNYLLPR